MTRKPARMAREQRVDQILSSARDVFSQKGYDGTAVAEIAARMGVVEGNVYKYFRSKRELLLKVLDNWYEEMFAEYAKALVGVNGTRKRVTLLIERHLRSIKRNPALCRLMFREVRSEKDYPGSSLHTQNRRYTQLLVDELRNGLEAGDLRADASPALLRDMVYGGIEHHTWSYVCGRGSLNPVSVANDIATLLFEGAAKGKRR